jgi:hypothetical protein
MRSLTAALAHNIGHHPATVPCLTAAARRDTPLEPDHRRRLDRVEREVAKAQALVGLQGLGLPTSRTLAPHGAHLTTSTLPGGDTEARVRFVELRHRDNPAPPTPQPVRQ